MITLAAGKVGVTPGTTTIALRNRRPELVGLGSASAPAHPDSYRWPERNPYGQQDPGRCVRNNWGELRGSGGLGVIRPTDFELAKIRGYLPYESGWIVGNLSGTRLGQDAAVDNANGDAQQNLEMKRILEELRSIRSQRIWGAVTALVGVGGLVIAAIALRQGA
jgi:hypothetical protein